MNWRMAMRLTPSACATRVAVVTRHCAGLEANALGGRSMFAQQASQGARIRLRLTFENDLPSLVDHTHTEVSLRETSRPTYCFMVAPELGDCESSMVTDISC